MSRTNKDDHPHKFKRIKQGKDRKYIIFRCILPGCTRTVQKEFINGIPAICWRCGREFIMNATTLQARPGCGCTRKHSKVVAPIAEVETKTDLLTILQSVEKKRA
jgi:hypothetical protein